MATAHTGRALQKRAQPHSLVTHRLHRRPSRVLMTADCVGGVWTHALDLARGLAAENIEIVLATMGDLPSPTQRAQAERLPGLTLRTGDFKLEWMPDCWQDVARAGDWLLELEAQFAPDVIHLNGFVHGALPWHAPILMVGHSCVLSWWEAVKREPAPDEWQTYHLQVMQGLQAADCVAAPTAAMLASLNCHYGPFQQTEVIPNGRQHSLYHAEEKEPFLLTAGRVWDEAKNVGLLECIAPELSWPVYVAGNQSHPNSVKETGRQGDREREEPSNRLNTRIPKRLNTGSGFHLLGALPPEELANWYARAAVYALPARYEPFGLSALEAALSGCALVLGDIASLREVWEDAALYADPNKPQSWIETLKMVMTNASLREEMAARAQEQAQKYTLAAMTEGYLDIYGRLLTDAEALLHYVTSASFPPESEETLS